MRQNLYAFRVEVVVNARNLPVAIKKLDKSIREKKDVGVVPYSEKERFFLKCVENREHISKYTRGKERKPDE